jgi:hypothetical protein
LKQSIKAAFSPDKKGEYAFSAGSILGHDDYVFDKSSGTLYKVKDDKLEKLKRPKSKPGDDEE